MLALVHEAPRAGALAGPAFGYLGNQPVFTLRCANEAASVAEQLSQ